MAKKAKTKQEEPLKIYPASASYQLQKFWQNQIMPTGRYLGIYDAEDDFNFVERFTSLKTELESQIAEEADLNKKIAENLSKIKLPK